MLHDLLERSVWFFPQLWERPVVHAESLLVDVAFIICDITNCLFLVFLGIILNFPFSFFCIYNLLSFWLIKVPLFISDFFYYMVNVACELLSQGSFWGIVGTSQCPAYQSNIFGIHIEKLGFCLLCERGNQSVFRKPQLNYAVEKLAGLAWWCQMKIFKNKS